jgi:hypothetical protein
MSHDFLSAIPGHALVFEIIPPRSQDGALEVVGLETVMQSLVLSEDQPIALEIAGSATRKRFLVRATDEVALYHASQQFRLRYPQADIRPITREDDPLRLGEDEAVTVAELRPGAAEYLPMREWSPTVLQQQKGIDPLLGVLAALATVPKDHRAIAQMVLVPAPPTWSQPHRRKSIEHALEPERVTRQEENAMRRNSGNVPSTAGLVVLGLVLGALYAWSRFKEALPAWLRKTIVELILHGQLPPLTGEQRFQLFAGMCTVLVLLTGIATGVAFLKRRFAKPVYDQRVVAERTGRLAYRGRIQLYVIGPAGDPRESQQIRRSALDSLIAAYRQFHTADAGHFVPLLLSSKRSARLFVEDPSRLERFLSWLSLEFLIWLQTARNTLMPLYHKTLIRIVSIVVQWVRKRWSQTPACNALFTRWITIRTGVLNSIYGRAFRFLLSCLCSFLNAVSRLIGFVLIALAHLVWRSLIPHKTPLPGWASGIARSRHFLTGDFISSAWRLPGRADLGELAGIAQKRARSLPLPPALANTEGTPIGECSHAGISHPFVIPSGFFANHTFLGGKSGEGKSTLMVHPAQAVMLEGTRGLFLLDPHGDLAEDVLRMVPPERLDDVVLIDLGETDFCVGINPLDVTLGRDRDLVVASLISVFSHIWQSSWGPRMEAPFRAAILTLFEANLTIVRNDTLHGPDQQFTLLDVVQVLTDESFCHDLLAMTSDLFIHRFWYEYFSPLSLVQQRDRIDPVLTKMMQFESRGARRILGQSRSTIRLHEIVEQRKLLITRLAFSEAGAQTGSLIGATLLGLLMVTLREQSRLPVEERKSQVLLLDEFQTFGAGADLSQLLAELRKYGGSAVLATQSLQYLTTLDPALLPTVLANTKQYFLFRLSAPDSATIAPELDVAPADLVNLDSHTCYVRLVYARQLQPTFSLLLCRPSLGSEEQLITLRIHSQHNYTRPAAAIEQSLIEAAGRAIAASVHQQQKAKQATQTKEESDTASDPKSADRKPFPKKREKGQVTSLEMQSHTGDAEPDECLEEETEE